MMAKNFISEDDIEQAILQKLNTHFGFELLNCYTAKPEELRDNSKRADKRDVILADRLTSACLRLNPTIPANIIESVVEKIMDRRGAMSSIAANRELDNLIRNGVPVSYDDAQGVKQNESVRLIDFNDSRTAEGANEYLAVSQLWIKSTGQSPKAAYRRPDVILYVNGLPIVFIELKNSNVKLRSAYDDNLTNYKNDIPQLFHTNAFCIFSNAIETKVGSFTAGWEHFFNWLRVDDEKEKVDRKQIAREGTSLEYAVAGLCQPYKLLDYVENFILFHKENSKIIAQNHQFIGVNNAYERFLNRKELDGKLGVFWHTQGSGKSFSMIFYARKIFRKVTGNFSFVVVTDRQDLDGQIYRNFVNTGTVTKQDAAQPKDAEEMRKFLGQNKKVVFTLIQKFRYDKGKKYPHLFNPDEREIIVIVDEAHRTQYKSLAENMRAGLKGAHFLAFTGTPLLGKERKTNSWFGGYVSEYNFQQAMEDEATVPLFYEKRVPEMLIQNDDLGDEFYELLEDENLDEAQQQKLERKFAQEMEVIKRDSRLETIAKDIVYHFPRRGYMGKGMVISLDKFTAVKMYDKVQRLWKEEIKNLRGLISRSTSEIEKERLKKMLEYMKSVEMAVVISDPKADEERYEKAKLDIKPHIKRLESLDQHGHDIEYNFKDPENPLQLVFVCAMWLTGFDAPSVSTLYLDKPMKDHTLMQTIARANRVASHTIRGYNGQLVEKKNGEIVDYYNVFRNMKKALKDYAQGEEEDEEKSPVQEKGELFKLLDDAIAQAIGFCRERNINLESILEENNTFKNIENFQSYADILLSKDEWRKSFYVYDNTVSALYEACKPEIFSQPPRLMIAVMQYLRGVIDSHIEKADIDEVSRKIAELLDESVVVDNAEKFAIKEHQAEYQIVQKGKVWDLSKIDFEKLRADFAVVQYKNIEIAEMRAFIEDKLRQMLEQNHTRIDFAQRLQEIIDKYNSGGSSTENYFDDLVKFTESMKEEDERHAREGLSEDELELYDVLKKEKLTKAEEQKVKLAAKHLITRLKEGQPKVLVQDWWKDTQSKEIVRDTVRKVLNEDLPESYDRVIFNEKSENVFEMILGFAAQGQRWAA
ncbi:MAG: type I restriction endonuclease subunit R [Sulfuricurvum sp.]|uniref:type I restriction endonuclease subunit R n=1 Tax=Sulfuricurvum sp. TaxID=2025608 RepID=UPI0026110DFD|nr:type I restriction endonuclease subunit R [Sulfuricurvum sp.]MDD2830230.1 type I restriction endonuclease subunit R [Sulfuricurvum sp.]MDD4950000.1 type I restriction endonuclease subunit R [Sulfuricurvum sp.]